MLEIYSALAGLGLFFAGLQLLSSSMLPLAGKRVRLFLSRLTKTYLNNALVGSFLGAITQSTSGSTYVCIGLIKAGAIEFQNALVLSAWTGVGTSILVFLVSVDIRLAGLYLVSIVGLAYLLKLERLKYTKNTIAILFALGLLFLGLGMLKQSGALLNQSLWVTQFIGTASHYSVLSLVIGLVLTLLTQSSSTITIITITLCASGVINFSTAAFFVFGANIGSGLSILLLSLHLKGTPKQLAAFQCLVKILGVVCILPLFMLASYLQPDMFTLQHDSKADIAKMVSILFFSLQVMGAIVATSFRNQLARQLTIWYPEPREDQLSKPQFIYIEAADDTEIGLSLLHKEQARLIKRLPLMLRDLTAENPSDNTEENNLQIYYKANNQLLESIRFFTEEIARNNISDDTIETIFLNQNKNQALTALNECIYVFTHTLITNLKHLSETSLHTSLYESSHLILMLLADLIEEEEPDPSVLLELTNDKNALMEGIRNSLLTDNNLNLPERQSLLFTTSLYERVIWQTRELVQLSY